MPSPRHKNLLKIVARPALGIGVLAALIAYCGPREIVASWVNYDTDWIYAAAAAILCSTMLGAFNLFLILRRNLSIRFKHFLAGYWLSWAVGLVVPGQIGDVIGLTLWMKRRGYKWEITSGVALIDKVITLVWMLTFALGGLFLLLPHLQMVGVRPYVISIMLVVIVSVAVYSKRRVLTLEWIREFFVELRRSVDNAKAQIAMNSLLTPIKILFIASAYWAMFKAAGVTGLPIGSTILLVAAASLVSYVPISFNGMGTVELAGVAIFGVYDIEPTTVISVFVSLRILVFTLSWLPSVVLLLRPAQTAN